MKGKPLKNRELPLKKRKPRGKWKLRSVKYVDAFLMKLKEGYEAYEITDFESEDELKKIYESLRNIVKKLPNPQSLMKIRVGRDIKTMKIWLYTDYEES